jgi:hypothetical protein
VIDGRGDLHVERWDSGGGGGRILHFVSVSGTMMLRRQGRGDKDDHGVLDHMVRSP